MFASSVGCAEDRVVQGAPRGHAGLDERQDFVGVRLEHAADLELLRVGQVQGAREVVEHPGGVGAVRHAGAHLPAEEPSGEEAGEGEDADPRGNQDGAADFLDAHRITPCSS